MSDGDKEQITTADEEETTGKQNATAPPSTEENLCTQVRGLRFRGIRSRASYKISREARALRYKNSQN